MLAESDTLLTIAEIGIAFAGFAALAGVIGRRRDREGARFDLERLRTVVYVCLLLVITSLVPVVVAKYQLSDGNVWRSSSFFALLLNWVVLVVVWRHANEAGLVEDKSTNWVVLSLEVAAELPLIVNVLGVLPSYAPASYFTFLFVVLLQTAFLFLRLLDSLFAQMTSD